MGQKINRKDFEVMVDGKTNKFCVVRPDTKLSTKAQLFKAKKIRECAEGGALLREEVDKLLRERKIWDDEKENLYKKLVTSLKEDEDNLALAKKNKKKLTEVKDIAIRMANSFQAIQALQAERSTLENLTAEGMAGSAEFDYLLSNCIKKEDGTNYYNDYDDMVERESCPVYEAGKSIFLDLLYEPYEEQLKKRPEWQFLIKYKFVDDKRRLIDKDGHLIDGFGRKVDEQGRLINEDNKLINDKGELVDELGFLLSSEDGYYLDDDGNPIIESD